MTSRECPERNDRCSSCVAYSTTLICGFCPVCLEGSMDALEARAQAAEAREAGLREALTRCIGPGHREYLTRGAVEKAEAALATPSPVAVALIELERVMREQQCRWCRDYRPIKPGTNIHVVLVKKDGTELWQPCSTPKESGRHRSARPGEGREITVGACKSCERPMNCDCTCQPKMRALRGCARSRGGDCYSANPWEIKLDGSEAYCLRCDSACRTCPECSAAVCWWCDPLHNSYRCAVEALEQGYRCIGECRGLWRWGDLLGVCPDAKTNGTRGMRGIYPRPSCPHCDGHVIEVFEACGWTYDMPPSVTPRSASQGVAGHLDRARGG